MPAPQNNQGFVQPSSGGTGNWLSKLFGGIGDNARARSMAQLQLDLHAGKADIDTFHKKDRMTYQTAMGEYTANETYKRSGKEIRRGIKKGPELNASGVAGFDRNGRPMMQKTGQRAGSKQKTDETTTINPDTPPTPPAGGGSGGGTPPTDRAANPARKARERKPKEPGYVQDKLPGTGTPRKKAGATSAGGLNPLNETDAADTNKRANITGDGAAPSANTPAVVKPTARKPRTPKAGA